MWQEKRVLESRAGESDRHIALKILAYLLFRERALPLPLLVEQAVGQRHKPDLAAIDAEGAVCLWIDCGQIEPKRLARIVQSNPDACILVVKPTAEEARLYAQAAARALPPRRERKAEVQCIGFDAGFLKDFLTALRGANHLQYRVEADDFCFLLNEMTFHTTVTIVNDF